MKPLLALALCLAACGPGADRGNPIRYAGNDSGDDGSRRSNSAYALTPRVEEVGDWVIVRKSDRIRIYGGDASPFITVNYDCRCVVMLNAESGKSWISREFTDTKDGVDLALIALVDYVAAAVTHWKAKRWQDLLPPAKEKP